MFMSVSWPSSIAIWLAFLISIALGYVISFLIDYSASLLGFWLTQTSGVLCAKWSVVRILGGTYVPLWVFPPVLGQVILFLPFAGVSYVPLSILVGRTEPSQIPAAFGMQMVWIAVLGCLSRVLFSAGVKKLSVQGG